MLARPRSALNDPIAAIIAKAADGLAADRHFCRSRSASEDWAVGPKCAWPPGSQHGAAHAHAGRRDSMPELGVKVLGNTASAIPAGARPPQPGEAVDRAIDLLTAAERVEFVGHYRAGGDGRAVQVPALAWSASVNDRACRRWPPAC